MTLKELCNDIIEILVNRPELADIPVLAGGRWELAQFTLPNEETFYKEVFIDLGEDLSEQ